MMGNNSLSYSLLAGLCFSLPVQANDSTAAMGTGGLVFTQSEHIVMAEEDLFVSQKKVRVQYRFTNTSSRDITTRVAFPLPDLRSPPPPPPPPELARPACETRLAR